MTERAEPKIKRAVGFFDGQNLFHHAKDAFGHYHPNYDPKSLFEAICTKNNWQPNGVRFYTGVPPANRPDPQRWHEYWSNRLLAMNNAGIVTIKRDLRYRGNTPQEKGIDLRIGLDMVRLARLNEYDVAVIFSQDQDLVEAVDEVEAISQEMARWILVACAFPSGPQATSTRGINRTKWIKMDQTFYDQHIDPRYYRPRRRR